MLGMELRAPGVCRSSHREESFGFVLSSQSDNGSDRGTWSYVSQDKLKKKCCSVILPKEEQDCTDNRYAGNDRGR